MREGITASAFPASANPERKSGDCAICHRPRAVVQLRNDSKSGGGFEVTMLQDDELLFSRRCVDERGARYVAQAFKQDTVRAGWVV